MNKIIEKNIKKISDNNIVHNNTTDTSSTTDNTSKRTNFSETIISIDDFTIWENLHYNSILEFYNTCKIDDIKLMFQIINTNKPISLRTIERYITKYCDMEGTVINVDNQYIKKDRVHITICYNSFMDTYGKILFDSCRRKRKFIFHSKQLNESILTTLGQLIFFKCCFNYDLIIHTRKNIKNMEIYKKKIDNFYKKKKYSKKNLKVEIIYKDPEPDENEKSDTKSSTSIYKKIVSSI